MDDEKKYKEALEKLQEALAPKDGCEISGLTRGCIESIFPELAISEDEKIRKEIIEYIKTGTYHKDWIAWLEKQGDKSQGKSALEAIKEEKVDNSNKVETKFHEGDWIVNRNGGLWKIKKIFKNTYDIESLYGESLQPIKTVDMDCHLWTIKDAKPGDILSNGKMIVIFKEFEEPSYREHIIAYIGLDGIGAIQVTDGTWQLGADKAHPATKEQSNKLLKAMADAGYEWDAEKKELKKVENEIEVPFSVKDSELKEEIYYIPKGFYAEIDDDKVVIKKGKKPTAWSEEDEKNLTKAIWYVENPALNVVKDTMLSEWLKSIKERVQPQKQWKPSEEQMDALEHFVRSIGESGYASPYDNDTKLIYSLLEQLKQL